MGAGHYPDDVRALFLSDLHLGYRLSNPSRCIELLNRVRAEKIYLIGDILDVARLARQWYWPALHQQTVDAIGNAHHRGAQVYLMPGNHDPCFRSMDGLATLRSDPFDRIRSIVAPFQLMNIGESFTHQTLTGKKLLITHGDLFDHMDARLGGIPILGSRIFDRINRFIPNRMILALRRLFKLILTRPDKIEAAVIAFSKLQKYDGAVFGHLHSPSLKMIDHQIVANTGDWLENESCLMETNDGSLILINFGEVIARIDTGKFLTAPA